mmetsp:Transcript_2828/g.5293  ORF Transcript_2828/g.5293 Transcript_2828/m.5293 type:complete len:149 (-) Transcript_2828:623-1069(-)
MGRRGKTRTSQQQQRFKIKPSTFFQRGLTLVFCGHELIQNIELNATNYRHFRSHYGVSPGTCAVCWNLIEHTLPRNLVYTHLLWALMFLKVYGTESVLSTKCNCDEKTFRTKVWIILKAIDSMKSSVVSSYICSFLINNYNDFLHCHF